MAPKSEAQNEEIRKETESKIFSAAMELFVKQGFEGTSIKEIAVRANISVGLIYRHFDSKQDLFNHILEDALNGIKEIVNYIKSLDDPIEALRTIATIMIDEINSGADYINLHLIISHALTTYDDPMIDEIKAADLKLVESIEEKIYKGQLNGSFRKGCTRTYAWMFLSSIEGAIKASHVFSGHHKVPTVDNLLYYLMEVKQ